MIRALGIFAVTYLLMSKPHWPVVQLDRRAAGLVGAVLMIAAGVLTSLTVRGTVARLLVNDRGDVDGPILSSREQVKFRPHNGATVVLLLGQQPGATVQASGYGTHNGFGTVVDAATITMSNQTIALRSFTYGLPRLWLLNHSTMSRGTRRSHLRQ